MWRRKLWKAEFYEYCNVLLLLSVLRNMWYYNKLFIGIDVVLTCYICLIIQDYLGHIYNPLGSIIESIIRYFNAKPYSLD